MYEVYIRVAVKWLFLVLHPNMRLIKIKSLRTKAVIAATASLAHKQHREPH